MILGNLTSCAARRAATLSLVLSSMACVGSHAQDSLQVTFVGDRELELREVTKPISVPERMDLGIEKPTISYTPVVKSVSPKTETEDIQPVAVKMDAPLPRLPRRPQPRPRRLCRPHLLRRYVSIA